jgi:hypothetical protein
MFLSGSNISVLSLYDGVSSKRKLILTNSPFHLFVVNISLHNVIILRNLIHDFMW